MTRQEQIEALWREFGRQPITPQPPENSAVKCRHYVKVGPDQNVVVDEMPEVYLVGGNPLLRAGQCPACLIIYWFTDQEKMRVIRVDDDTTPDAGGEECTIPVSVVEGARAKYDAGEKLREYEAKRSRRIPRGRKQ
jgi:hypothetical protein